MLLLFIIKIIHKGLITQQQSYKVEDDNHIFLHGQKTNATKTGFENDFKSETA
jgi:hypothetical protein